MKHNWSAFQLYINSVTSALWTRRNLAGKILFSFVWPFASVGALILLAFELCDWVGEATTKK